MNLKVGIISDSHHRSDVARSAINFLKKSGANVLIHAGDIVELSTLNDLKRSNLPYFAILGNNDSSLKEYTEDFSLFKEPYNFEFGGFKFRLAHYPYYLKGDADIYIYGHTHMYSAVQCNNSVYINSGEICARKKPKFECALLECKKQNRENLFKIYKITSNKGRIFWQTKIIE